MPAFAGMTSFLMNEVKLEFSGPHEMSSRAAAADKLGFLERLPKWVICIPLLLQWIALSLRYRSTMLPSIANPAITAGGLVGEGKTEYFRSMGAAALAATAKHGSFVVNSASAEVDAAACMNAADLEFPIIAKPDVGWCGFGVRLLNSTAELSAYLAVFPERERVVLQAYVPSEGEAGIFYVRRPGDARGEVIGLALRYFPRVIGDGKRTIAQLIAATPRLERLSRDGLHRVSRAGDERPEAGQVVRLATIGSTRVGAIYRDGERLITPQLRAAIDAIACDMDRFYFGRFDVRYDSEDALKSGRGFTIIEVNGAGSEAIEAWDPELKPLAAFRKIFRKQAWLFRIGADNRPRGFRTIATMQLLRLHLRQQRLILRYPPSN